MADSRRGFLPTDEIEFDAKHQIILKQAQKDLLYLLERGYPIKNASVFVGNHYLLSERQRLAVVRASATDHMLQLRNRKQLTSETIGKTIYIDGLNTIITLEVVLSKGTLIRCMDHTIRDLAGLRGTYRLIDQTHQAIQLIGNHLVHLPVEEVIIYLDAPVSNTGRLKTRIFELLGDLKLSLHVELVNNADSLLEKLENVITTDAIILNRCNSWYNLVSEIVKDFKDQSYVDLSNT